MMFFITRVLSPGIAYQRPIRFGRWPSTHVGPTRGPRSDDCSRVPKRGDYLSRGRGGSRSSWSCARGWRRPATSWPTTSSSWPTTACRSSASGSRCLRRAKGGSQSRGRRTRRTGGRSRASLASCRLPRFVRRWSRATSSRPTSGTTPGMSRRSFDGAWSMPSPTAEAAPHCRQTCGWLATSEDRTATTTSTSSCAGTLRRPRSPAAVPTPRRVVSGTPKSRGR